MALNQLSTRQTGFTLADWDMHLARGGKTFWEGATTTTDRSGTMMRMLLSVGVHNQRRDDAR